MNDTLMLTEGAMLTVEYLSVQHRRSDLGMRAAALLVMRNGLSAPKAMKRPG